MKTILQATKVEISYLLISKLIAEINSSEQHGVGIKINRDCKTRLANSEIKLYICSQRIIYTYTKSKDTPRTLLTNDVGEMDIQSQENKVGALASSVGNNQFSVDQTHKCET